MGGTPALGSRPSLVEASARRCRYQRIVDQVFARYKKNQSPATQPQVASQIPRGCGPIYSRFLLLG